MLLAHWVRRLLGKLCTECDGSGFKTLPNIRNEKRLPCLACMGTGERVVQRSEQAIEATGEIPHERGRRHR